MSLVEVKWANRPGLVMTQDHRAPDRVDIDLRGTLSQIECFQLQRAATQIVHGDLAPAAASEIIEPVSQQAIHRGAADPLEPKGEVVEPESRQAKPEPMPELQPVDMVAAAAVAPANAAALLRPQRDRQMRAQPSLAKWDVGKLIAAFGVDTGERYRTRQEDVERLVAAHAACGFKAKLAYHQVRMWQTRGAVPANRLVEVFIALLRVKGPFNPFDFVVTRLARQD